MAFKTRGCLCKIQGHISIRPLGFTLSRLLPPLLGDPNKLVGPQASFLKLFNIPAQALTSLGAFPKVYTNEKI